MKSLYVLPIALFSLVMMSCGDDDGMQEEMQEEENVIVFENTTYALNYLVIDGFRESNKIWITNGTNVSIDPPDEISADGKFDYILFNVQNVGNLESGTYTFNSDDETLFTFFGRAVFGENNSSQAEATLPFVDGTLTVNISGDEYEFIWDCTLEDNVPISGNYKGEVDQFVD